MKRRFEDERSGLAMVMDGSPFHGPLHYIMEVKDVFHGESAEYKEFKRIMLDYKAQRFDIESLKAKIKELFKEHRSLIVRFNAFLPEDNVISLPPENDVDADVRMTEYDDAGRFQEDWSVYKCFVLCLTLYVKEEKPPEVVRREDIESLTTKALLGENEFISTALLAEIEESLQPLSDEKEQAVIPQMEFEYPDPNIHDDIYQLIKYSCGQKYKAKQFDKVMSIWMNLLEPLLGIPPRHDTSEDTEDAQNSGDNRERHVNSSGSCAHSGGKKSSYSGSGGETFAGTGNNNVDVVSEVVTSNALDLEDASCIKIQGYQQVSSEEQKTEREEGELSPERDFNKLVSVEDPKTEREEGELSPERNFNEQVSVEDPKTEREEGELSPERDFNEQVSVEDPKTEREEGELSPCSNSVGEAMCISEDENSGRAVEDGDTNAQYEADESAQGLSDSNDACDNAHREGAESGYRLSDDSESEREEGELSPEGDFDKHKLVACSKIQGYQQVSIEDPKSEREEGELSPEEDFDENNDADDNAHRECKESNGENRCDEDGNDSMDESEGVGEETSDVEYNGVLPLFYGNDSFYILFRLHHMLYKRLETAKLWTTDNDTESADRYGRFEDALYNLLNGSFDQEKFEQKCYTILGAESHQLFTLDKWICRIVKQLHWIATREVNSRFMQLYYRESSRKLGRFKDSGYNENARRLLPYKNIFRLEYMAAAARLSIQLMKP